MLSRSSRQSSQVPANRQHGLFQMCRPRLQLLWHAEFGNNSASLRERLRPGKKMQFEGSSHSQLLGGRPPK
jgi:hypothetical protein